MRPISVHVTEDDYDELKSMAARTGRPVAELIRRAMGEYIDRERKSGQSLLSIAPHAGGKLLEGWTRAELIDEMRGE